MIGLASGCRARVAAPRLRTSHDDAAHQIICAFSFLSLRPSSLMKWAGRSAQIVLVELVAGAMPKWGVELPPVMRRTAA
jgi:hypothetical protein